MRIDIKGAIVPNDDKEIYDYFGVDATSPKDVVTALNNTNGQAVEVYINSGGGEIFAGSEIYTALKEHKGEVDIYVTSLAASAASVIAMARRSHISPTAMLMVHNVSTYAGGDYRDMAKMSDTLQQTNKAIAMSYMEKSGMSEKDALAMMDKETWLPAQEAVNKGLIDSVMFENYQLVASFDSGMLPRSVIDKIRNEIKNPFNSKLKAENEADFLMQKAKAKLNLLNLGGINHE